MRLLIVAYAFPPNSAVGAMRPLRWCKHLARETAWEPAVISVAGDTARSDASLLDEVPAGVEVHRVRSWEPLRVVEARRRTAAPAAAPASAADAAAAPPPPPPSGGLRGWVRDALSTPDEQGFWVGPVVAKALALHRQRPFDAVLVTSPPWSAQFAGRVLATLLRIPWIADYRDPWNDIDRGRRSPFFEDASRRAEAAILPRAAAVVSSSETYTEVLRERFPRVDPAVFTTVHNGFDETKIPLTPPDAVASDRFTLVHLGTLYEIWQPHALFAGIAAWLGRRPDARAATTVRFVGRPGRRTLAALADLGLADVVEVTGFVDHAAAVAHCRGADALLLALGSGDAVPAGWLPSKLFEYIACQRPILANVRPGEARRLIAGARAGWSFADDETAAVADRLDDLYDRKRAGGGRLPWANDPEAVARLTQRRLGRQLAAVLDRAAGGRP